MVTLKTEDLQSLNCSKRSDSTFVADIPLNFQGSFATNTTSIPDGDTFFAISLSAGISVPSLQAANPGVTATEFVHGSS